MAEAAAGDRRRRLSTLLVVAAAIALARWGSPVVMPVLLGLFAICVTWPIFVSVRSRVGQTTGAIAALGAFLVGMALLVGLLAVGGWRISQQHEQLQQGFDQVARWMQEAQAWVGASTEGADDAGSIDVAAAAAWVGEHVLEGAEGIALAAAIQLLLLLEWHRARGLLQHWDARDDGERRSSAGAACLSVRRYFYVRTLVGLITGCAVWLACLAVGLDMALTYGVLNFGLNYFPTIGSLLGVIPPVVLAVASSGDPMLGLLALGVVGGVQLLMGTVIDPLMQGRALSCSSTLVLVAVIAGAWIGGVAGAFLGVPVLLAVRAWAGRQGGRPWLAEAICLPERPQSQPPG